VATVASLFGDELVARLARQKTDQGGAIGATAGAGSFTGIAGVTRDFREQVQGFCHELQEIIEGQEYIVEDAQFALAYAVQGVSTPDIQDVDADVAVMIEKMLSVKSDAENLYRTYNCKQLRENAGLETR
jgi:hypothetical protein